MFTILLVILILMLLGALPTWPYSRSWGYSCRSNMTAGPTLEFCQSQKN
jgi:hypothetical protein